MIKPTSPIPLTWLLNQDAWVEQWPIIEPKLSILKKIAAEQLKMVYIEPVTSNHNTPIFVIPRYQDATTSCRIFIQLMIKWKKWGTHNQASPILVLFLHLIIFQFWILKIAFFQIPWYHRIKTTLLYSMHKPAKRNQWTIFPHEMKHSPTSASYIFLRPW